MPRSTPALVALLVVSALGLEVRALSRESAAVSAGARELSHVGRIEGVVRDQVGQPVHAVSIIAMGATVAAARSDTDGRFSLVLEPGEYVLRVSRAGYISTYREAVHVRSSAPLKREITLVKADTAVLRAGLPATAVPGQPEPSPAGEPAGRAGVHAHSEAAWRLRHLRRSVLRDSGMGLVFDPPESDTFSRRASRFDPSADGAARLASSLFSGADFTGQVNFLTTSLLDTSVGWLPDTWPRRIASFTIGSVQGVRGDWRMRGAIGGGDLRSWALLGEYQSPAGASHEVRLGVSYSAQGYMPERNDRLAAATPAARSVAGIYAYDRWTARAFEIDYGARIDRYDYIASPELFSPRVSGRLRLPSRLFAVGTASQRMIAPGADEFLPPASPGPWVPPERTFSALLGGRPLQAERVRHLDVGLGREFGRGDRALRVIVRAVRQSSGDQIATLFGLDSASGVGHYYVAAPGDVDVRSWNVEVSRRLLGRIDARVEYAVADAAWGRHFFTWMLRRSAPSVVRRQHERLHDLTTVLTADLPETSTRISFAYRVNSAFSHEERASLPVAAGRFDLRLHQALPYQPIRGASLEVLVAVRTLFRELGRGGSFYDELLTVSPPLRLMGGVQVRF
jgi:hypothetical protein